jgi:Na+/H+ antiporter NhaD/arsenite permease-like protein
MDAILTSIIFGLTYLGLGLGRIPGLHIDRSGIALVGAALMLATGMVSMDDAFSKASIDYPTLLLLFGMMIVIGFLRISGIFQQLADAALARIRSPRGLLAITIVLSGVLSAFLINDIVCLTLTPLVLHIARRLRFDPLPHLIALATAANIGSTGTITGNPQNIYIGSHSGISYARFAEHLIPVAAIGLVVSFLVVAFIYRRRLDAIGSDKALQGQDADPSKQPNDGDRSAPPASPLLRRKSVAITIAAVMLFFAGLPLELVALGAAALLMLGRTKPEKYYREVDWSLLVMFAGLFIVVHAFQIHVVSRFGIDGWSVLLQSPVVLLSVVSAGLSNLVSNVPAVLLLEPVVQAVPAINRETAWLALAMSSTFAGNLTVLGSIANLIVAEKARQEGVIITFWEYCKVGIPLTILTLGLGIAWLELVH